MAIIAHSMSVSSMRLLTISNFSCIIKAEITLGRMTVLIGPQASGKSVISKLIYFFQDLVSEQLQAIEDEKSFDAFKVHVKEKFLDWFPIDALGQEKFCVEYSNGSYQYRITRKVYKNEVSDSLLLWFSKPVRENYENALARLKALKEKAKLGASNEMEADELDYDLVMSVRNDMRKVWANDEQADYVSSQLFIPAGRSFFTSVGKTLLAFDQAGMLDPLTKMFGRRYASAKDMMLRRRRSLRYSTDSDHAPRRSQINFLLGGDLRLEKEKEFLLTNDGRKVPISILSSGQQELLPLLVMTDQLMNGRTAGIRMIYIEEPEAHLFPSAQSRVIELLATLTRRGRDVSNDLFITTHSPYVLSKINNLMKAGDLGRDKSRSEKVSAIIPKSSWLYQESVKAYAVMDGVVNDIMEDGLIAADYLDDVSGEIAEEFSTLLEMEYSEYDL